MCQAVMVPESRVQLHAGVEGHEDHGYDPEEKEDQCAYVKLVSFLVLRGR